jgi:hypothetical protein
LAHINISKNIDITHLKVQVMAKTIKECKDLLKSYTKMTKASIEEFLLFIDRIPDSPINNAIKIQEFNNDLENMLQKQQQVIQLLSNTAKVLNDTKMAVTRKIG